MKLNFAVVENKLPLKPWTMTDVINRLLDVCEPIRQGEKPRFRLNGMSADGKIISEGQEGAGLTAGLAGLAGAAMEIVANGFSKLIGIAQRANNLRLQEGVENVSIAMQNVRAGTVGRRGNNQ